MIVKYECERGFFYGERNLYEVGERSHYVGEVVNVYELDEEDKTLVQDYGIFTKEDKDEQTARYNTIG